MKVIKITDNGRTVNHHTSPNQGDYTLCGLDMMGDSKCGIFPSEIIEGKITCTHCIMIIKHRKRVKMKDVKK